MLILRADCTQVQFLNLNDFVSNLKSNLPMLCVLLDNATSLPIWLFKTSRRREEFFSFTSLAQDPSIISWQYTTFVRTTVYMPYTRLPKFLLFLLVLNETSSRYRLIG